MNTFSNTLTLPRRPTSDEARRAALLATLHRAGNAVWRSLGISAALQALASIGRSPVKAKVADPAAEAAEVRAMAQALLRKDPRFAADLFAAADRHEIEHGA